MSRKAGRVRCGACQRVLRRTQRRVPRAAERAQLAATSGIDGGRLMWEVRKPPTAPEYQGLRVESVDVATGQARFTCPCGRSYEPPDLGVRLADAAGRGEDLYLVQSDTTRGRR